MGVVIKEDEGGQSTKSITKPCTFYGTYLIEREMRSYITEDVLLETEFNP